MFKTASTDLQNETIWQVGRGLSDVGLHNHLLKLKIKLNLKTGNIFYTPDFTPPTLKFNLIFVRHGETFGNCGQSTPLGKIDTELVQSGVKNPHKRIYQGNVDKDINQLTEFGKQQANKVAAKLKEEFLTRGWGPDIIFSSPLTRAQDTADPFVRENGLEKNYAVHSGLKEISFGAWDNRRVCDLEVNNPCHLFYLQQHALIKQSGINGNNEFQEAENFCELLLRAQAVLDDLNRNHIGKNILMFSHSMFGAACQILLGQGKKNGVDGHLAFDGKSASGNIYTMPNAVPIVLHAIKPKNDQDS